MRAFIVHAILVKAWRTNVTLDIISHVDITLRLRLCNFHIYIDTTLCRKTFLKLSKACRT